LQDLTADLIPDRRVFPKIANDVGSKVIVLSLVYIIEVTRSGGLSIVSIPVF
jgi:hypothetical protein